MPHVFWVILFVVRPVKLFISIFQWKLELLTQFPALDCNEIVLLNIKGCICHFVKWQIIPFISKVTKYLSGHPLGCQRYVTIPDLDRFNDDEVAVKFCVRQSLIQLQLRSNAITLRMESFTSYVFFCLALPFTR